jgi:hypothetical protein
VRFTDAELLGMPTLVSLPAGSWTADRQNPCSGCLCDTAVIKFYLLRPEGHEGVSRGICTRMFGFEPSGPKRRRHRT